MGYHSGAKITTGTGFVKSPYLDAYMKLANVLRAFFRFYLLELVHWCHFDYFYTLNRVRYHFKVIYFNPGHPACKIIQASPSSNHTFLGIIKEYGFFCENYW